MISMLCCQCSSFKKESKPAQAANVVVSVAQQKIALYGSDGKTAKSFPVSTSKFGLGDKPGTYSTPLGLHEVVAKVGHGARSGTVYKGRQPTGEVIKPGTPGRDPIVSRIMWLRGMEAQNKNAYRRCIYIHGTADELNIGKPVSYGCVRMKSQDVIDLFERVGIGTRVLIVQGKLPSRMSLPSSPAPTLRPGQQPPIFLDPKPNVPGRAPVPSVLPPPQNFPAPAPYESPVILAQNTAVTPNGYQSKTMANGTVVYTPPTTNTATSSRIILKSRRSASDGLR
ncbi:L,D-transpeptidase [Phragmitibacter flavus]|nr:L,D-transpeptidase [Phragmitibacter flavus]